jgi:hypothetical protein
MIRHVVFYSYRSDVPDAEIQKVYEDLDKISEKLPGRLTYTWGKHDGYDQGHRHYTHCLVVDFVDEKARNLFMTDPERAAFSQREVASRMNGGKDGAVWMDFEI